MKWFKRFAGLVIALMLISHWAIAAPKSAATISLVSDGSPQFGEQVTFDISTSGWVRNNCYQNQIKVLEEWHGWWIGEQAFDDVFTLGPTSKWISGSASCRADLIQFWGNSGKLKILATVNYEVQA